MYISESYLVSIGNILELTSPAILAGIVGVVAEVVVFLNSFYHHADREQGFTLICAMLEFLFFRTQLILEDHIMYNFTHV